MATSKESGFKKQPKQDLEQQKEQKALLTRLLVSTGIGLAVFAVLLLAAAAVCLRLDVAQEHLRWVSIPLAAAAAFLAGYLHVRPQRKQGLLLGLLAGAALYVGVLALAFALSRSALGVNAVLLLLAVLFGAAAGGVFSANRKPGRPRSKAKKRRR